MVSLRVLVIPALLAAPPALAEEPSTGAALYAAHCATCHGTQAHGDGPMAALLNIPVPDLTGLSARNGGSFPMFEVVQSIDGRARPGAHGGPMPLWGAIFGETPGLIVGLQEGPLEAQGRIMALTLWLESIQTE
jgi:mono/diheme cytochrome c family protein